MSTESSLIPEEHGSLNKRPEHFPGGAIKYQEFVQSLLAKYANNRPALELIAVYTDPEYVVKIHEYKTAWHLLDYTKIAELETWFNTNYPSLFIEWTRVPQKKQAQPSTLLRIIHKIFGIS